MDASCINYKETGFFSQTVIDYLEDQPDLKSFYGERPTMQGFAALLNSKKVIADRTILTEVLTAQYAINPDVPHANAQIIADQIGLLGSSDTYTITTGHQLNIFTGPLYFIYKIVTAINLSRQLKNAFPDKNFIPVYWMATEDHDFAEINHTNVGGKKIQWDLTATGATGRLPTKTIRQALNQYKGVLGIAGHGAELAELVETAYTKFSRLADAMRYLVSALFSQYGLLVIDADDRRLKQQFAGVMEQDITRQSSFKNITASNELLQKIGVHIQVNPREINFFYLKDALRERIVFENGGYHILNTTIRFSPEELSAEIKEFPERFSPNVVMRPMYQEVILPNLAYIGGGAELVYWLQLKANFDHYQVDFPILILRNSGLVIRKESVARICKMALSPADFFKPADKLKNEWVSRNTKHDLSLAEEWREMQCIFEKVKLRAHKIDGTLTASAEAVQARLKHAIDNLERKLLKAEKRNYATRLSQLDQIKADLFPGNSLQERNENFGLSYVKWGQSFIDELIVHFKPLDFKFTIVQE